MKEITGKWPKAVRRIFDDETPFALIRITEDTRRIDIHLYWTKGGDYGRQVRMIVHLITYPERVHRFFSYITVGCGYSKKIHALEHAAYHLDIEKISDSGSFGADKWHVGGNFYSADFRTEKPKSLLRLAAEMVVENADKQELARSIEALGETLQTEGCERV